MKFTTYSAGTGRRFGFIASAICCGLVIGGLTVTRAGNIITSGTTFKVLAGTTVVSSEALMVNSGATLDNAGVLVLKKDLTNQHPAPNSIGSGTVVCSGTAGQMINGQNIIQNLTVNNATGVTIGGNTTVNGTLVLTSGKVTLGSNHLLLGPSSTLAGTPSAAVMIIVTGTGELRKEFPTGFTGTFTFPVGDNTGTAEYSPVTLNFTAGTFAPGNYVGVSLVNSVYPDPGITGNYLNRYWNLSSSGISGFSCDPFFDYVAADVVGSEADIVCARVSSLPWIGYNMSNTAVHRLSATGLTTFSSFTGVNGNTTPPQYREVENVAVGNGDSYCFDATEILTIAGNGTTFSVANGGTANLVAGSKILILPGAVVAAGGQLHAWITTDGSFCNTLLNPLIANSLNDGDEILQVPLQPEEAFIRIYPNPTTDIIVVELLCPDIAPSANVTIYTMQGGKLLQKTVQGETKFQFSLAGKPVGMYMVQVRSGEKSQIAKVVKN